MSPIEQRLLELAADRALCGLGADEDRELAARLAADAALRAEAEALERAVAALDLAFATGDDEPLPPTLRARLDRAAEAETR